MPVEINNLTTLLIDRKFLRKVAQKVLELENIKESNLSIALVSQDKIRKLNKKYLNKNRATDVLAFPEIGGLGFDKKEKILGEIVICPKEIEKNAKRFNTTFKKELSRVLIHGILHLLGYNHEKSKKDAKTMREKEEQYLLKILKL